ncbi:MAG: hypothetical protein HY711_00300 [Candidatus Melainabacteria bacterium]|nr:hypothetical protein [Candidatus Melainabacteria bacterium]
MPEPKRKLSEKVASDLELEGFENIFDNSVNGSSNDAAYLKDATVVGDAVGADPTEKLLGRFGELMTVLVDQRVETAKIANQLIENQRQLIATQQILIRLMERSLELTRHITGLEQKLPAVFELPKVVENLRVRVAQLEGVEVV